MPELTLGGVVLMPVIVAIVQLLKAHAGLPSQKAPLVTALLAVLFYILVTVSNLNIELAAYIKHFVNALILFLSASGFYSVGKIISKGAQYGSATTDGQKHQ